MSALRNAARQALEFLEALEDPEAGPNDMVEVEPDRWEYKRTVAATALRKALAQLEQESGQEPKQGLEQRLEKEQEKQPYDQTALELCDVCGWKTVIPGEGCLNCARTTSESESDSSPAFPLSNSVLPVVKVVEIIPTTIWIENDLLGSRHVMLQHQGDKPFTYCSINYNHRYTSNSMTHDLALNIARSLGAQDPVEERVREFDVAALVGANQLGLKEDPTHGPTQGPAAPAELPAAVKSREMSWPKTAQEVRDFIWSDFNSVTYGNPPGDDILVKPPVSVDDVYTLSIHDLSSAFYWWAQSHMEAEDEAQEKPPVQVRDPLGQSIETEAPPDEPMARIFEMPGFHGDAAHRHVCDLYEGHKTALQTALASREPFTTDWYTVKNERHSARIWRERTKGQVHVEVRASMGEWSSLVDNAFLEAAGKQLFARSGFETLLKLGLSEAQAHEWMGRLADEQDQCLEPGAENSTSRRAKLSHNVGYSALYIRMHMLIGDCEEELEEAYQRLVARCKEFAALAPRN